MVLQGSSVGVHTGNMKYFQARDEFVNKETISRPD